MNQVSVGGLQKQCGSMSVTVVLTSVTISACMDDAAASQVNEDAV
jgi:hypothetical protein